MKGFWIVGAALLALFLLAPGGEGDVADLLPVELLYVYIEEENVRLETDGGQWGQGKDLRSALSDLHDTSPGEVFLETADYLVVTEEAKPLLPELAGLLRPAAKVCQASSIDTEAAQFLKAHQPNVTLGDILAGEKQIETLIYTEGRYRIES